MARVYEGRLESLAGVTTRVAVKVIHPDFANEAAFQDLFITEARISARLEHQNLVRIQQFNREGNLYYLVMEYIDGVTFRKIISLCRRHRLQLPVQVIAELGRQVCEGLHYAHNLAAENGEPLQLVHRDIKPSNLMLNGHGVVKVLDFGISSAHGTPDAGGAVKGTWGYMALEQAEGGHVGPAADVFGLGAVLYELASLEPLFSEKENAAIRQRLLDDSGAARAAALGGEWSDLGGVLVRALQRDPEARHRNAAVFGRALSTLVLDPVGAHDSLARLLRELRELEGAPAAPTSEKARSMPTMSRTGLGSPRIEPQPSLPLRFGDAHGAGPPPRPAPFAPSAGRLPATLAAAGLLAVALAVLAFAAWQLLFGAPRRAPQVVAAPPPALADVAEPAPPVVPPAMPPSTAVPSAPPATAADPTPATAPTAPGTATARAPQRTASGGGTARAPESDAPVRIVPAAPTATTTLAAGPASASATTSAAPDARSGDGLLTISSDPRAQVMVNGQYVRYTPVFQYSIAAGTHTVLLVAEDGRRKSFKVTVEPNQETRRIWLFDEDRWSDP